MRSLNPWPVFPSDLELPVTRSLSIQFILQTLGDGLQLIDRLKKSALLEGEIKHILKAVSAEIEKVFLFSLENPMGQKGGVLDRLCFYSEILIQASQVKDPELFFVLEEMRKPFLLMKSKMMVWKKMLDSYPLKEMREQLMQLFSGLSEGYRRFFEALVPFLREARSDENVLVYLIENKQTFNEFFGEKRIELLLQSLFPAGFDQLRAVIYEGFTRRGFHSFFSSVEPLINEIQWETTCHSPAPL